MKKLLLIALLPCLFAFGAQPENEDATNLKKIFDTELNNGDCYEHLHSLCTEVGGRLSGSPEAEKAVRWGEALLKKLHADTVYLQDVMVPHWVRGAKEKLLMTNNKGVQTPLPVCALGGSVATPSKGVTAKVIEVHSIDELKNLGEAKLKGKVVFFNRPMQANLISTFQAYGECVDQRVDGASAAAPLGAVAVLVRSMNLRQDDYPHTGVQIYKDGVKQIPTAAISTNAADKLSQALKNDPNVTVTLTMSCQTLPDAPSHNVVAEIRGTEHPEQVIVVGGHLDSWDLAQGAHDDGAGVVHSIEVLNLYRKLGWKPKHTIRCVLFMNEENGSRGALKYAEIAKNKNEKNIAAIESDRGGFTPRGFTVGSDSTRNNACLAKLRSWAPLLAPYELRYLESGEGGEDVDYLQSQGTVVYGFIPDSQRYFDHHHAASDTFAGIDKRELELGAASITALVYLIDNYGVE